MAGEEPRRCQGDAVAELGAALGEQLVEDPAHREHGRTGLDGAIPDRDGAHLPAGMRRALENRRVDTGMGEPQGGGEATDPGTDHDDALLRHGRSELPRPRD